MNKLTQNILDELVENTLGETYQRETVKENIKMFLKEDIKEQIEFVDSLVADWNFNGNDKVTLTDEELLNITHDIVEELKRRY